MKNEPLVVERTFDAPAAMVWKALTENEQISQWSFQMTEFKPEVGFEFEFHGGKGDTQFLHRCKIMEVVPGKKLAYSWRYEGYEGDSLVTFELTPEGGRTRVKLTHEGLDTFPAIPDFARNNFEQGWTSIIGSMLKDYVEKQSGATADREIVITRTFDAPRELVWDAWTKPEHVTQWWGPNGFSTTIEKMDVRPGGEWKHVMHGPDGANYPNHSMFTVVIKPERITYQHKGHREGGGTEVNKSFTWTFETVEGGKTKVTIHMVFATAAERDQLVKEYGVVEGGKQTLARLDEYLAKM